MKDCPVALMILLLVLIVFTFCQREYFTTFSDQSDCFEGCNFNVGSMDAAAYTTEKKSSRACEKLAKQGDENMSFAYNEGTNVCKIYNKPITEKNISNTSGDWVVKNKVDGKIYTSRLANDKLIDIAEPVEMPNAATCKLACDREEDCNVSVYTDKYCTLKKTKDGKYMKPKKATNRTSVLYIKSS